MAIFAQKDINIGEELTHSYLATPMLLYNRNQRADYLHFRCQCLRCLTETDSIQATMAPLSEKSTSYIETFLATFKLGIYFLLILI